MGEFSPEQELTDEMFWKIARHVYELARINLTEKKKELVRARIGKVIRTRKLAGFREYYDYLTNDTSGEATTELLNAISTNLTSFFRESKHFDYMREVLLPEWAKNNRDGVLRGWSAGCSTGEEIYTISITISEHLPELSRWSVKLLATDIDTNVIACGARGIYHRDRLRDVSPTLINRYFTKVEGEKDRYQVKPMLRNLIAFRRLNLMSQWPFRKQFDFIFCRNVMIYFDQPTQQMLVDNFYRVLKPGGHLFIGHSEGLTGVQHTFRYERPTVYRKP